MQHPKIGYQAVTQLQSLEDCQFSNVISANQTYLSPEKDFSNGLGDNNVYQAAE